MRKIFKISKKLVAIALILVIGLNYILPIPKVFAQVISSGEGTRILNLGIDNDDEHFSVENVTVNGAAWSNSDGNAYEYRSSNGLYTVVINVRQKGDEIPNLVWGGNWNDYITSNSVNNDGVYTYTLNVNDSLSQGSLNLTIEVLSEPEHFDEPGHEPHDERFNGNVYFIWNCGGNICKYHITGMQGRVGTGNDTTYPMNYVKEKDVADEDKHLEISNLGPGDYHFIWDDAISNIDGKTTWKQLEDYVKSLSEDAKRDFSIDPTSAKWAANAINTNGDRSFRLCIYDDENYEALEFGAEEKDYTYFPSRWDPVFFNSEIDISSTTKESPAYYETYILEPNLKFKLGEKSNSTIKSVKALDVNEDAVSISKDGDEYTIRFNSNYYDSVIFEVEDNSGKKNYIEIKRIVLDTMIQTLDNDSKLYGIARLLFPASSSYEDYEIIADITYKDGTRKSVKAKNIETRQDLYLTGEMVLTNEWMDGKNLKSASYGIELEKDIVSVNFTAIKKGALDGNSYGGTFAGSGKGVELEHLEKSIEDFYNRR